MHKIQLHTAISEPRFLKYLKFCDHDEGRAWQLYTANLVLCQNLYAVIGMFEVVLRNAIDRHYRNELGDDWMLHSIQPGGCFRARGCESTLAVIREAITSQNDKYDPDAMVSRLTFGFWTYQFSARVFAAAGSTLLEIFPHRPYGTRQKDIFKSLFKINEMRNRIAHYEPVCFDTNTGKISAAYAQKRYYLIIDLLSWLGYESNELLRGIDSVPKAIKRVNAV